MVPRSQYLQMTNFPYTWLKLPLHPHGAKIPPSEIDLTPPNCFVLGQNFHDVTVQVGQPKYFLLVQFFTQTPQGTWGQKVTALQF